VGVVRVVLGLRWYIVGSLGWLHRNMLVLCPRRLIRGRRLLLGARLLLEKERKELEEEKEEMWGIAARRVPRGWPLPHPWQGLGGGGTFPGLRQSGGVPSGRPGPSRDGRRVRPRFQLFAGRVVRHMPTLLKEPESWCHYGT